MTPAIGSSQKESAFRRGNAMSGAPSMSGTAKFARPGEGRDDEEEDHQRRVHRDEPVEGLRVDELQPRLGQLRAEEHREQAADREEEEGRDEVLDPDDLVVGVHAEVVPPASRAVARVILRSRRAARHVVEPVVERADPGEEADRSCRHRADDEDDLGQPDGIPAPPPAKADTRAASRARRRAAAIQSPRTRPGPKSTRPSGPRGGWK